MKLSDAGYDGYTVSARFMRINQRATLPGARDGVGSADSQGFRDSCPVFRSHWESLGTSTSPSPGLGAVAEW
eukprot:3038375-Amphidinium_carterae.1